MLYRGADKSLAQPGRKQARKHVRDARNFNKIEKRAVIKIFFSARQSAEGNSSHSDRNISLFPSGLSKDLSAPLYFICKCMIFVYLNINQLDALNFMSLFHASTCFEQHVLIVWRSKSYYTASGIITLIGGRLILNLCT